jgi:hypothetical protein
MIARQLSFVLGEMAKNRCVLNKQPLILTRIKCKLDTIHKYLLLGSDFIHIFKSVVFTFFDHIRFYYSLLRMRLATAVLPHCAFQRVAR